MAVGAKFPVLQCHGENLTTLVHFSTFWLCLNYFWTSIYHSDLVHIYDATLTTINKFLLGPQLQLAFGLKMIRFLVEASASVSVAQYCFSLAWRFYTFS